MRRPVIVTGAGSGIGLRTVVETARRGFPTVAAVHRPDQVEPVRAAAREAGVEVAAEVLDVADEAAASGLIDRVAPWALVNNAGYMNAGQIEDVPIDDARRQLEVMVVAPIRLVQLALPGMRRRGGGRIVNVTSSIGDVSLPFQAWYDASKQALDALSDALRPEVAGDGVDVVVVQPGAVATPLWRKARAELLARRAGARDQRRYDRALVALDEVAARGADPDGVAGTVADVLQAGRPRFRYRVGRDAGALVPLARLVPTSVRDRVLRPLVGR